MTLNLKVNLNFLNPFCTSKCIEAITDSRLSCDCGVTGVYDWLWEQTHDDSTLLSPNRREITFHPVYSSGTAALKGMQPLQPNLHHYWEMKMTSHVYGTDVMIGVGTKEMYAGDWRYRFFSLLGCDERSWGYSYTGEVQHNGITRPYGSKYGMGSLIGLHLDLYRGTLEFYYNRVPLGTAFVGLKKQELYPIVSSTAAQSSMQLTCAVSVKESLEFSCLKAVIANPILYKQFLNIPGLANIFKTKYFWMLDKGEKEVRLNANYSHSIYKSDKSDLWDLLEANYHSPFCPHDSDDSSSSDLDLYDEM